MEVFKMVVKKSQTPSFGDKWKKHFCQT